MTSMFAVSIALGSNRMIAAGLAIENELDWRDVTIANLANGARGNVTPKTQGSFWVAAIGQARPCTAHSPQSHYYVSSRREVPNSGRLALVTLAPGLRLANISCDDAATSGCIV